jgi:hypothetical protein
MTVIRCTLNLCFSRKGYFAGSLNYVEFLATGSADQILWRVDFSRVKPVFDGLSAEKDLDFYSVVLHLMKGASVDLPGRYQLADLVKMDAANRE